METLKQLTTTCASGFAPILCAFKLLHQPARLASDQAFTGGIVFQLNLVTAHPRRPSSLDFSDTAWQLP
jgi:hypothetical protein